MIRPYRDEDIDQVIDIWYEASLIATPFMSEAQLSREREQIRSFWMPRAETWVYEHEDDVVAFIALIGDEVGGLFVHPRAQRMGIGTMLMDHAVSLRGRLTLYVFEENRIGRAFYDRYGFEVVDRQTDDETGHPELRLEYGP